MNILDPKFKYIPSNKTDIRETFKRVRAELEARKQAVKPPVSFLQRKKA